MRSDNVKCSYLQPSIGWLSFGKALYYQWNLMEKKHILIHWLARGVCLWCCTAYWLSQTNVVDLTNCRLTIARQRKSNYRLLQLSLQYCPYAIFFSRINRISPVLLIPRALQRSHVIKIIKCHIPSLGIDANKTKRNESKLNKKSKWKTPIPKITPSHQSFINKSDKCTIFNADRIIDLWGIQWMNILQYDRTKIWWICLGKRQRSREIL